MTDYPIQSLLRSADSCIRGVRSVGARSGKVSVILLRSKALAQDVHTLSHQGSSPTPSFGPLLPSAIFKVDATILPQQETRLRGRTIRYCADSRADSSEFRKAPTKAAGLR